MSILLMYSFTARRVCYKDATLLSNSFNLKSAEELGMESERRGSSSDIDLGSSCGFGIKERFGGSMFKRSLKFFRCLDFLFRCTDNV